MSINVRLKKSNCEKYCLWNGSIQLAAMSFSFCARILCISISSTSCAAFCNYPTHVISRQPFDLLSHLELSLALFRKHSIPFHPSKSATTACIHQNVSAHRRRRKGDEGKITHAVAAPADKRAAAANLKETMVEMCIICGAFSTTVFAEK